VISPARTEIKGKLPLGINRLSDSQTETVSMDPALISKHFVVLAGSGSGKTVLVRRLVEEAALLGIPSIMLDCANDLARMGDPWPARPETWFGADEAKAKRYRERAEVVVWTPGREKGNPLTVEPLPDLAAVADDADELEQAVLMAIDAFQEIVAPGRSMTARKRIGGCRPRCMGSPMPAAAIWKTSSGSCRTCRLAQPAEYPMPPSWLSRSRTAFVRQCKPTRSCARREPPSTPESFSAVRVSQGKRALRLPVRIGPGVPKMIEGSSQCDLPLFSCLDTASLLNCFKRR
jgi:hypothetical protein